MEENTYTPTGIENSCESVSMGLNEDYFLKAEWGENTGGYNIDPIEIGKHISGRDLSDRTRE